MCGIAGFADFTHNSHGQHVARMACAAPHRGPDGEGAYFSQTPQAQIGLGHRRLSIIDLSTAAAQPMHHAGLHVVFNGEIYNYTEIRNRLIQLGHHFTTHGDTEIILHAWQQWGEAAIHQWHGMFAIALYDKHKEEIICIRDRAGTKPLYYYHHEGLFLFGSELKNIVAHPRFRKELHPGAAASFMQYGYVSAPHSIYRHTYKLKPGHLLRLGLSGATLETKQYWNVYDWYNKPKLKLDFEEAKATTAGILEKAFQYRMVADVPVGVFLSGGFDSTCVTALLQKGRTEKLKTFTIGSTDNALDEAPFAKKIAAHLGTDHTEYYCTPKEALDILPHLPFYYDEPFADSSAIPTILVSRLARRQVTVALSADAGDEIFAGYNRYDYLMRYGGYLNAMPAGLRKAAAYAMEHISSEHIPYFNRQYNFHSRYRKLRNLLQDPSPAEMLRNLNQVFDDGALRALFVGSVPLPHTAHVSRELKAEHYDPLSYMMAVDYQTYMADDILQKVDRATMSASLEGREPFLDQAIIEWAARLPNAYKYHRGQKKYILRQIVYDHVPRHLMERKKMGFGVPLEQWLQANIKHLVLDELSDESLSQHGMFNKVYVHSLLHKFFNGHTELYLKIWHLLVFQMWHRKWMQ